MLADVGATRIPPGVDHCEFDLARGSIQHIGDLHLHVGIVTPVHLVQR